MEGRIDPSEHLALPWRLPEFTTDFELIDAWALPVTGTFDEFPALVATIGEFEPGNDRGSGLSRLLFGLRARLGEIMGWDAPDVVNTLPIPGCDEHSVRDRLPTELAETGGRTSRHSNFRGLFEVDDEAAMEVSNPLVHAILHLGWVERGDGVFQGQMGVFVLPRNKTGKRYMNAIAPFRHHIVYPALLRRIEAAWTGRPQGAQRLRTPDGRPTTAPGG